MFIVDVHRVTLPICSDNNIIAIKHFVSFGVCVCKNSFMKFLGMNNGASEITVWLKGRLC